MDEPTAPQAPTDTRTQRLERLEYWLQAFNDLHVQGVILVITVIATADTVTTLLEERFVQPHWLLSLLVLPALLVLLIFAMHPLSDVDKPGAWDDVRPARWEVYTIKSVTIAARIFYVTLMVFAWSVTIARLSVWILDLIF